MRRKKRYNVYSNATIKRCPCCTYDCVLCKGPCKLEYMTQVDPKSISEKHCCGSDSNKKRFHKDCTGSLMPGQSSVCYSKKSHRPRKNKLDYKLHFKKTRIPFNDLQYELIEFKLISRMDKLIYDRQHNETKKIAFTKK